MVGMRPDDVCVVSLTRVDQARVRQDPEAFMEDQMHRHRKVC